MCHSFLGAVDEFEQHRVCDFQSSELVQRARRHDDLSTMVDVVSFGSRQHSYGIAAIIFIEAACGCHSSSSHHRGRVHTPAHHRVVVVIAAAELDNTLKRSAAS